MLGLFKSKFAISLARLKLWPPNEVPVRDCQCKSRNRKPHTLLIPPLCWCIIWNLTAIPTSPWPSQRTLFSHLLQPTLSVSENLEPLRMCAGPRSMANEAPTSFSTPPSPNVQQTSNQESSHPCCHTEQASALASRKLDHYWTEK